MRAIKFIVIHCSATLNGAAVSRDRIEEMHNADPNIGRIGYHRIVEVTGEVKDGCPLERPGVHVRGSNANSIGVCMVGTDKFTAAQWDALKLEIEALEQRFPDAVVQGHRDFSPDLDGDGQVEPHEWVKICPGFDVREWLLAGKNPMWSPAHVL